MKKLFILFLITSFTYAAQPVSPIQFLGMTSGATVMPTILPTYVTHQYFNPSPGVKRRREIEKFINENFESLKEQIAKGDGEHLYTLAVLSKLENVNLWKEHLQSDFEDIYNENRSREEIVNHIIYMTNQEVKAPRIDRIEEDTPIITPIVLP